MFREIYTKLSAVLIFSIILSACGGGGGAGEGTGSGSFDLSSRSVSFEAERNGTLPADKEIAVSWSDTEIAGFAVVYSQSDDLSAWLTIDTSGNASPINLILGVNSTDLAPGTYTTTLPFYSGNINSEPLSKQDIAVSYTVTDALGSSTSSLSFSHVIGAAATPTSQDISITGESIDWSASASESWVQLASTSGSGSGALSVSVDLSGLAEGDHNANITLMDTASNDSVIIPVTLSLTAPAIVASSASLEFAGINGDSIAPQSVDVALSHGGIEAWTASANATWLVLDKVSGSTPDAISVSVDPSVVPLASGDYNGTITINSSSGGYTLNETIDVSLSLTAPTLSLSPATLTIGGDDGLDESSQEFSISLNTGSNSYPWSISLDDGGDAWLSADKSSGNASATTDTVSLDADRRSVVGGTYTGTATVTTIVNGDTVSTDLPITFNLEAHKLFVADNGVAFTSTPSISKLSRSLTVTDTLGKTGTWSASADQSWLSVTVSGNAGDDLVLTANPASLTADMIHYATVTVSSSDATIENTESIRVGLWVGSSDPNSSDSLSLTYSNVITDPIRPYLYVHDGGTDIDVYHVFSGALVTTISAVAAQLGDMTVSSDGATLYAADLTNKTIVPVNLENYAIAASWALSGSVSTLRLAYTRTKASTMVMAGNGRVYDATSGSEMTASFVSGAHLSVSRDGSTLCAVNAGVSPYTLTCYQLDYTALNGGVFEANNSVSHRASGGSYGAGSSGQDVAVSADGSRVYVASGAPYSFIGYDYDGSVITEAQNLPGDAYPNNIEIGNDDLIYAGASVWYGNHATGDDDVWVYNAGGVAQSSYYLSASAKNLLARQLVVSADGSRMIVLTNDPKMIITTLP